MIYLDNAATTKLNPEVLDAMMPYLTESYGNPGSLHTLGREAAAAVDHAREQTASFMGCDPSPVIFTSGGSEGNNLVVRGVLPELRRRGMTGLLVSAIEHESLLKAAKASIKEGFHLSFVNPYYDGEIMPDAVRKAMRPGIGFVSVMTANNETGVLNDVNTICGHCHNNGALFHTDAVQAAGTEDLREIHCDFMTVSSHKIHGPKGVGALFAADPSMLVPLIYGGAEQEHGLRGGTENVAGIVGFGKACELAAKHRAENREKLKTLRNAFVRTLKLDLAYGDFYVNGVCAQRTPKVLSLLFPGIDAQTLLLALDSCGVCVSAGSACTAHESQPSHVLTAMHLNEEEARSTVRVSFSADNTGEEVVRAAHTVASAVKLLRHMDT